MVSSGYNFSYCISPTLIYQLLKSSACFRPEQCIINPTLGFVYIFFCWHYIIIASEYNGLPGLQQLRCMLCKPLKPL